MVKRYGFNPGSNAIHERPHDGIYVSYKDYQALEDAFSRWKSETCKDVARIAELNAQCAAKDSVIATYESEKFGLQCSQSAA